MRRTIAVPANMAWEPADGTGISPFIQPATRARVKKRGETAEGLRQQAFLRLYLFGLDQAGNHEHAHHDGGDNEEAGLVRHPRDKTESTGRRERKVEP